MDRLSDFREVYAHVVMARAASTDAAVHAAFAQVPRHEFLPPGPWRLSEEEVRTTSADPALVYQDLPWGLAPERRIPSGQPSLHARCMVACELKPAARVVHVGAGAGYYTAILAELVGPSGQVLGFELDQELAQTATANLTRWPWARVEHASAVSTPFDSADLIYVSAGVEHPPRAWFERLRPRGRLLLPLTPQFAPLAAPGSTRAEHPKPASPAAPEWGGMLLIREQGSAQVFSAKFLARARFVPCIGAQDPSARSRMVEAFRSETSEQVRSLRLSPLAPDVSAWFVGSGYWLSTSAPNESGEPELASRV
jgi:protein-L-isoaspartate(D-aspartate) O-methyltransferase